MGLYEDLHKDSFFLVFPSTYVVSPRQSRIDKQTVQLWLDWLKHRWTFSHQLDPLKDVSLVYLLESLLRKGPHAYDFWCIAIEGLWISNQQCLVHFQCFFPCIPCFKDLAFICCEATLQDPHAALRAASSSETCNLVASRKSPGWNVSKSWSLMFEVGALVSDILIHWFRKKSHPSSSRFCSVMILAQIYGKMSRNDLIFFGWLNFLQHPVVRVSAPAFFENFRPFRSLLLRKNCPEAKHKPKGDQNSEQSFFTVYKFFLVLKKSAVWFFV